MKAVRHPRVRRARCPRLRGRPDAGAQGDQVLVRVVAATVNPCDVAVRENRFPTPKQPPKTIGRTAPAWSTRPAPRVTSVKPGDEVCFSRLGVGSEGSYRGSTP